MSRRAILWVACLAVSACTLNAPDDTGPLFGGGAGSAPREAKALSRATLGDGDIVLEGPKGWCIEPASLKSRRGNNFASLAGCYALTQGRVGAPVPYGILTVAISAPRQPGNIDASRALREAVSDDRVLSSRRADGVALVHLVPETAASEAGIGDPHWRGVFVQGRRVVVLAAYGPKGGAMSQGEGGTLLLALADRIRTLSRVTRTATVQKKTIKKKKTGLDLGGAIGRLLNGKVSE